MQQSSLMYTRSMAASLYIFSMDVHKNTEIWLLMMLLHYCFGTMRTTLALAEKRVDRIVLLSRFDIY